MEKKKASFFSTILFSNYGKMESKIFIRNETDLYEKI